MIIERQSVMRGGLLLGVAVRHYYGIGDRRTGWRFYPSLPGRKPSRQVHATAARAIPGWARK